MKNQTMKIVSIPNGMEFYFFLTHKSPKSLSVSIPNGMEFYAKPSQKARSR